MGKGSKHNKADQKGPTKWQFWNIRPKDDEDEDEPSEQLMIFAIVFGAIILIAIVIGVVILLYLNSVRNHRSPNNDPLSPRYGFSLGQPAPEISRWAHDGSMTCKDVLHLETGQQEPGDCGKSPWISRFCLSYNKRRS